jgi:hypothetical protein
MSEFDINRLERQINRSRAIGNTSAPYAADTGIASGFTQEFSGRKPVDARDIGEFYGFPSDYGDYGDYGDDVPISPEEAERRAKQSQEQQQKRIPTDEEQKAINRAASDAELNEDLSQDPFYRNLGSEGARVLYREYKRDLLRKQRERKEGSPATARTYSFEDYLNELGWGNTVYKGSDPEKDFRNLALPETSPITDEEKAQIYAERKEFEDRKKEESLYGRTLNNQEFYARASEYIIGRPRQEVLDELNHDGTATLTPDDLTVADLRYLGITRDQAEYMFRTTDKNVSKEDAAKWMKTLRESGAGTEEDPRKNRNYEGVISKTKEVGNILSLVRKHTI